MTTHAPGNHHGDGDGDGGTSDDDRQPDDAGQSGTLGEHVDDADEEVTPRRAGTGAGRADDPA